MLADCERAEPWFHGRRSAHDRDWLPLGGLKARVAARTQDTAQMQVAVEVQLAVRMRPVAQAQVATRTRVKVARARAAEHLEWVEPGPWVNPGK